MVHIERETKALYEMCAVALVRGNATLDGADEVGFEIDLPIFTVSHVATLTNTHPQTLRQYDRLKLIMPQRTDGGARRYSLRDIDRLVQTQRLSQSEGINLAGIMRILELKEENRQLKRQLRRLRDEAESSARNIFAANADGDVFEVQRSRNARHWRSDIKTVRKELPSSSSTNVNSRNSAENSAKADDEKSMVLWRAWLI